jgi:hypothetical protein
VSVTGSTVNLSWIAAAGAASYVLEAGSAPGGSELANFDTGSGATAFSASNIGVGIYYARSRARNSCGTGPASNEVAIVVGPAPPVLLSPAQDGVIPQNDPSTGCSYETRAGYGFQIAFDWSDVSNPDGVAGYEIFLKQANATVPAIDNTLVTGSSFRFVRCAAFVTDFNASGWHWQVRTKDSQGTLGAWSAPRALRFAPCRLSNGAACGIEAGGESGE